MCHRVIGVHRDTLDQESDSLPTIHALTLPRHRYRPRNPRISLEFLPNYFEYSCPNLFVIFHERLDPDSFKLPLAPKDR